MKNYLLQLKSIAEAEKNTQPNSTRKNSNRIQPTDDGDDIISLNDHKHHHRDHQSRHHHQHQNRRHHRQYSYSSCSTCSSFSNDSYSDAGHGHHHYRQYQHQHSVPVEKISAPRPVRSQTRSPPRVNSRVYRNTGTGSKLHGKIMKNSGVTTDLEDVPSIEFVFFKTKFKFVFFY